MQDQVAAEVMLRHIVHQSHRQSLAGPPVACFTVIYEVLLYNQDRYEETCLSGQNFTFWACKETSIPSLQRETNKRKINQCWNEGRIEFLLKRGIVRQRSL